MNEESHEQQQDAQGCGEKRDDNVPSLDDDPAVLDADGVDVSDEGGRREKTRHGTTASARFNILSTMVGGGSLSLPLAFQKSGNALLGPVLLVATAVITEFCFRVHGTLRMLSFRRSGTFSLSCL